MDNISTEIPDELKKAIDIIDHLFKSTLKAGLFDNVGTVNAVDNAMQTIKQFVKEKTAKPLNNE